MDITSTSPPPNYQEIPQTVFSWVDYALFSALLATSAVIGIYFGFFGTKQTSTVDYLLGGKTLKVFPVALSIIASDISGMALVIVPADVYKFGGTYWWMCLTIVISWTVGWYVFMPVFLKLQLTSVYEYLHIRFDKKVRMLSSFLYSLATFLYNPIVIYVPALAFSQVAGFSVNTLILITCVICIFYTTIGGLKAVVWTDTLQSVSIAVGIFVVFYMGVVSAGGFSTVWNKSLEGRRLDIFTFDVNPIRRDSSWAIIVGSTAHWLCNSSIHQGTIQRLLSVPSTRQVKKVIIFTCIGTVLLITTNTLIGLIMFASYSDCDPLSTKQVRHSDQLLPFYVMDIAGKVPGLSGLFIAGIFSASLSTLSTTLNALSATIYEDFISSFMSPTITEKRKSNILKLIVVLAGIACIAMVYVIKHLGAALPLAFSVSGITRGPLLGLFCLGMLFPIANAKGALWGGIVSLLFSTWMIVGQQWYKQKGMLEDFSKPVSTNGCDFYFNLTETRKSTPSAEEEPFMLYRISFWWFTFIGASVTIITGLIVSWFTRSSNMSVNPDLLSPVTQFLISKTKASISNNYYSPDKALHLVELYADHEGELNMETCKTANATKNNK